jgi:hypothetical protein
MIGESSPLSGTDAFARQLADYERRIQDLERHAARPGIAGLPYRGTFTVAQGGTTISLVWTQFSSTATLVIPSGRLAICSYLIRAIAAVSTSGNFEVGLMVDGTVRGDDVWKTNITTTQWDNHQGRFEIVGDGSSHTYALAYAGTQSMYIYSTNFDIIEA